MKIGGIGLKYSKGEVENVWRQVSKTGEEMVKHILIFMTIAGTQKKASI